MPGQFEYLNRLRKERRVVSLYLMSGIRFLGRVLSFDREGLLLDTKHGELLFAQQQISTIGPELTKARGIRTHHAEPRIGERHEEHQPRTERSDSRPMRDPLRDPMAQSDMLHEPRPTPRPAHTVQVTRKQRRIITRDPQE